MNSALRIVVGGLIAITGPAIAQSPQAIVDASLQISPCFEGIKPCSGEWRGIKWSAYPSTWNIQLDLPSGTRWVGSCKTDEFDDDTRCSWVTGDQFSLIRSDGRRTLVDVGLRKFPGAEVALRFDSQPAISTREDTWTFAQSAKFYQSMIASKTLKYRWYDWPNQTERGGSINLSGFSDAAILMEAFRYERTAMSALGR